MIRPFETFDPDDQLPYWFDGTDRAADDERTIVGYELGIDVSPDDALTLINDARVGGVVSFYPKGGTLYEIYTLRCRFFYDNTDHFDVSGTLTIQQH